MVGREKKLKLKVRLPKLPPMAVIKRRSKEWNAAMRIIRAGPPPIDGWRYLGTFKRSWGWMHEFHRGGEEFMRVRCSDGWEPDEIIRP
ncbi:MAG: hypothetical protein ACO1OB_21150 [Archangium sp.]